ncbi:MAG TPA: hypothetical protein VM686_16005, partial [Polyangiaceae bacterium]|nr:hypothetical protein [Polyangiaceae bacterium]
HALNWEPGKRVIVKFLDDTELEATVVTARTTAPAHMALGQSVRLWLELDADQPPGEPYIVRLSGSPLVINII